MDHAREIYGLKEKHTESILEMEGTKGKINTLRTDEVSSHSNVQSTLE